MSGAWRDATVTGTATGRGPVPLRPMAVGDLLDGPFTLLRADLRTYLLLTAVVIVPLQLLVAWVSPDPLGGMSLVEAVDDPMTAMLAQDAQGGGLGAGVLTLLQILVIVPVLVGLLARVGASRVLGEDLSAGEAVRAVLRRAPAVIGASLLSGIAAFGILFVGVVLLALGGAAEIGGAGGAFGLVLLGLLVALVGVPVAIVVYVLFALAPVVVVVEAAGPVAALRRSWRLMKVRFWAGLGVLLLAGVVILLLELALAGLATTVGLLVGGSTVGALLTAVGSILSGLVSTPFQALVVMLLLIDRRIRTEALDVEVAADVARARVTSAGL